MKDYLDRLYQGGTLTRDEALRLMLRITEGGYADVEVAALLSALNLRPLGSEELLGFRDAMLERAVRIDLSEFDPIDIVGTGGDGKNTFNISTLSAFVAAGAGVKVAKHGNNGVSSICGSSNILEMLGARFTNDLSAISKQLDVAGLTFLHAPLFHPAMKNVAHIRQALKVRTIFNLLGPLSNPCDPDYFLLGTYNSDTAGLYASVMQKSGKKYAVVHSLDGYDEISLTGGAMVLMPDKAQVIEPEDWGFKRTFPKDLECGKTPESAKQVFLNIIQGLGTDEQNDVVAANAGLAIAVAKNIASEYGIAEAKESLAKGNAYRVLQQFLKLQP